MKLSIRKKLLLTVGFLIIMMLITSALSILSFLRIDKGISHIVEVADPMYEAFMEIEMGISQASNDLLEYINVRKELDKVSWRDSPDMFYSYLDEAMLLAENEKELMFGVKVRVLYDELTEVGDSIIELVDKQYEYLTNFRSDLSKVDEFLEAESVYKNVDRPSQDLINMLNSANRMKNSIHKTFDFTEAYLIFHDEALKAKFYIVVNDFKKSISNYRSIGLSKAEYDLLDILENNYIKAVDLAIKIMESEGKKQSLLNNFNGLQLDVYALMNNKIQPWFHEKAHKVRRHAQIESRNAGLLLFITGIIGVIVGYVVWIIIKGIINSMHILTKGTVLIGEGKLDHTIEIDTTDEIGELAASFNEMAAKRRSAEGALQEREERIRLLLDSTAEGIFGVDSQGNCTFVNKSCLKMLGYIEAEHLLGKNMHALMHHTKSDGSAYPEAECRIYQAFREKKILNVNDEIFWRSDNISFPVEYWAHFIKRVNEFLGAVVTFVDITERRRYETERDRLNKELLEKNRELEQLVYVTSHDLRAPLVNINGFSQELAEKLREIETILSSSNVSPEIKDRFTQIINEDVSDAFYAINLSTSKMDGLLRGLLRFSRLGSASIKIVDVDINLLISLVINCFRTQFHNGGADIEVSDLPPCIGDEGLVNQLFSNLIDNAIKYLSPDRKGIIKVYGHADECEVCYCVEDNGIGIDPAFHQTIFEIFNRLDPYRCKGEGLGLTSVKKILSRLNGRIMIESEFGKGSKFLVFLPAVR